MKQKIKATTYLSKKSLKRYLLFLVVTLLVFYILSPQAFSSRFLLFIIYGIATGLSLAFFFSMIVSKDKSYIRALQDNSHNHVAKPLKNLQTTIQQLSKSVETTQKIITKQQTSTSLLHSIPINFSIIPSSTTDDAYILDNDLKIPFHTPHEKSIYEKLVRMLKKNGHHIRILKPYNPSFNLDFNPEKDIDSDLAFNTISSDFPQNLINFN